MSSQHPPLTCAEFKTILGKLGFTSRPKKSGTSHEDWVCTYEGKFYKVTVDCPKSPFSHDLISSMASQAGVTKKIIYDIHFGRRSGAKHGQELTSSSITLTTPENQSVALRFEVRKQTDSGFWCVWDTHQNCAAFRGQYTFLEYEIATQHAALLNIKAAIGG